MERLTSVVRPRHEYQLVAAEEKVREIEAIPLVKTNKKSLRQICKCFGEFPTSLIRFGPVYYADDSMESAKEDAWKQVLRNSQDEDEETTVDVYLSAISRVEKKARATYADEALDPFAEYQFRWMMIKDGCFFLQLALYILGASKQLGYSENHAIFGKNQHKTAVYGWIKSMFYAGNQIPLVVLNEFMNQTFFQNVIIKHAKWERPTDLMSKGVLYDLLILPATNNGVSKVTGGSTYFSEEQPSDLLHHLQNLLLGPKASSNHTNIEEDEDDVEEQDLEAGPSLNNDKIDGDNDSKQRCVSVLMKKGIKFCKSNGSGIRGIQFKNRVFYTNLYLPTIPLNRDTEMLFENLKFYEESQQQNEARSYLGLMNHMISTYEDMNHLASKRIFEASKPHYKERFLRMLKKLNIKEASINHDHRYVLQKLKDYSSFPWEYFKYVAIFAFIFTILQTVFGVLSYVIGVKQLHQS